jgi:hypothetical protein
MSDFYQGWQGCTLSRSYFRHSVFRTPATKFHHSSYFISILTQGLFFLLLHVSHFKQYLNLLISNLSKISNQSKISKISKYQKYQKKNSLNNQKTFIINIKNFVCLSASIIAAGLRTIQIWLKLHIILKITPNLQNETFKKIKNVVTFFNHTKF